MKLALLTIAAACGLAAQTTITIKGVTYNLNAHPRVILDGPSGANTIAVTGSTGVLAPRATVGNVPWQSLIARSDSWKMTDYSNPDNTLYFQGGQQAAMYAMRWYSDRSQTAFHDAALDMLNNIEKFYPLPCDEATVDCYAAGGLGYGATSYGWVYWNEEWLFAFELMRGEMTTQQQTDFASKWLNDRASAGGISGSQGTNCTNPSVVTGFNVSLAGNVITSASPLFGSGQAVQVGYWVAQEGAGGNSNILRITAVTDSTHATVSNGTYSGWQGYNGHLMYRRDTWQAGDCGIFWVGKHGRFVPQVLSYVSGVTAYAQGGGNNQDYSSNNTYAIHAQAISALLSLIDDDANAPVRSKAQLTAVYNDWYDNIWSTYLQHGYTGFHYTGSQYGVERELRMGALQQRLNYSINGTPPNLGTIWSKNLLVHYYANWLPSCASSEPEWGQDLSTGSAYGVANGMYPIMPVYANWKTTTEGKLFNWALRNRLSNCSAVGNTPGTNLFWTSGNLSGAGINALDQWMYLYTDNSDPVIDPTSTATPTAFALNQVDAGSATYPQSVLISRTGYSSLTDTLVNFFGMAEQYSDHNFPASGWYPGRYSIFMGNHLLGADGDQYNDPNSAYSSILLPFNDGGSHSDYMQIGTNNLKGNGTPCGATMPAANTDGTNNRYAYAMVNSTACYVTGVTRALRYLIHFKKSSTQQYLVVFDDVLTSSGQDKRTYLHYPNNFGASTDNTRGSTSVVGASITSSNPGTGHSDATQLLTTILAPGTNQVRVFTDNANGSYTGGFGKTFRVTACASANGTTCDAANTAAEFVTIHEPIAGTGNTMPSVTMLTSDSNWRAVQIAGSSPKAAVFAKAGQTYTSTSFTGTWTGTAQIAVMGLQAGTYSVTLNSTSLGSNFSVGADGMLYLENSPGAYAISQGGAPPSGTGVTLSGATLSGVTLQ